MQTSLTETVARLQSGIQAANAVHSPEFASVLGKGATGPTSAEGKAKVSLNALKTGLTGRTVLLPKEDGDAYTRHIAEMTAEFKPVGVRESALVQSIADAFWRLERIPRLEMSIYAVGRAKFADLFSNHDPAVQANLIEMHTYLVYEKQLRNLQIQEGRLRRQRDKDMAELRQLQTNRVSEPRALASGASAASARPRHGAGSVSAQSSVPGQFEFSTAAQPVSTGAGQLQNRDLQKPDFQKNGPVAYAQS